MITGFNTDIDHQGRVFHIQTEDKGLENPIVHSLIYCGGEIIASRQDSYAELAESGELSEDDLLHRMEAQHQGMIREIRNGKYDDEAPLPFGHNIITNRSLNEVVLEFLRQTVPGEPIRLELIDDLVLQEGTRPTLRIKVLDEESDEPIGGAAIVVRLISTDGEPRDLFSAAADADGYVEASFEVPELPGADSAILCQASAGGQNAEYRQLVMKKKRADKSAEPSG
jgi:hypothetical protein